MLWVFTSAFVTSQYFLVRENKAKAREQLIMAQIGALKRQAGELLKSQQGINLHRMLPAVMEEEAEPMETSRPTDGPANEGHADADDAVSETKPTRPTVTNNHQREVEYIPLGKLEQTADIFSAAWWQLGQSCGSA